jgi:ATP-binding cassette, subfamily C, bacterial CydD
MAHRRLLRSGRAGRAALIGAVALGAATAVATIAQAALLAHVLAAAAQERVPLADLRSSLLALGGVIVLRAALAGAFELSGRRGAVRVMSELRADLARAVLRSRPAGLQSERTGALVTAAVQGVDALEAYFARYVPQLVLACIVPVAILAFLAPRDLAATAVLAVTLPVLVVFLVLVGSASRSTTRRRWRTLSLLGGHFLDVVRGLTALRAHGREHAQAETLARAGEAYRRETMGTLRVAFLSALVLELAAMLGTALAAATVGLQLVDGRLTLEEGLTVLILAPELYAPVRALGAQFHASADGLAAAEQLYAVIDAPPGVSVPASPRPAPDPGRGVVALEGVTYTYPQREGVVLAGVDLALARGERVALIGPSGGGKSTVAALLLRLADPTAGRVTCDGVDLREAEPAAWRSRLAWVPQRPTILSGTIADNIRLGAPEARDPEVRAAAHVAQLDDVLAGLPEGLETRVGDGGRRLSVGEAKRVALARALVLDAPLLVLDEPTAHLDAATAAAAGRAIEEVSRGRTLLLIAHSPQLAALADRVLRLDGGHVLEAREPLGALV